MLQSKVFLIHNYLCIFDTAKIIINILIYKHLRLFNPTVGCFSFLQLADFHSYSWPIFIPPFDYLVLYCCKVLWLPSPDTNRMLVLTISEWSSTWWVDDHSCNDWMPVLVVSICQDNSQNTIYAARRRDACAPSGICIHCSFLVWNIQVKDLIFE